MFADEASLIDGGWRAFERCIVRLMLAEGFSGVRSVGQSGDRGADVIGHREGRRFLVQAKHWKAKVGLEVVDQTLAAARIYRANVPVIISLGGFSEEVRRQQRELLQRAVPLQLADRAELLRRIRALPLHSAARPTPREYQEPIITTAVRSFLEHENRAMVVMATGLGKTFSAAEAVRRMSVSRRIRTLVIAHANELVYQLERAFWPLISNDQRTLVWNGIEPCTKSQLDDHDFVFACNRTLFERVETLKEAKQFDVIVVDECHHAMADQYLEVLRTIRAGQSGGPFLLGLTATPFRADERDLTDLFGAPAVTLDLVEGMRRGFLANVDYRLHTDNIDWNGLQRLKGSQFSPSKINRTLFIQEWDDAVVNELRRCWSEVSAPRAIVFCGTIGHALAMRDRINALQFCRAEALYSQDASGQLLPPADRSRILCDFQDGSCQALCAVDILNEGIDVPDVNILVFQRVTHSRRIFVQQLGRGLRLAPGKQAVVVLDFVSDIRRFAAGLELERSLDVGDDRRTRVAQLGHRVTFRRAGVADDRARRFLGEWLQDVEAIQDADENAAMLRFPPLELLDPDTR